MVLGWYCLTYVVQTLRFQFRDCAISLFSQVLIVAAVNAPLAEIRRINKRCFVRSAKETQ